MRSIFKVFFSGPVVFLLCFLPALAGQPNSESDLKGLRMTERDLLRRSGFEPNIDPYPKLFEFSHNRPTGWVDLPVLNSDGTSLPPITGSPKTPQEQKVMKAIMEDFLVNDDTTGGAYQYYPAIAQEPSGNFIIVWSDERNGYQDIYAQRYNSSGSPIGYNFKVNDDVITAYPWYPAIAMDNSGNFVITWTDYRNGNFDIYAQRYNSSGTPLGSNFKVNDDTGTTGQIYPAISLDGSGNFIITWTDYRNGNSDIYAQRYNSSGTPLGSNFKVNDDTGTAWQEYPAIAMDSTGNFVITWYDYRNGNFDIYAQRYDSSGSPLGSNFKVNDDVGTASQYYHAISMNGSGNFVITWEDYRNGNYDIYAQRYDSSGSPLGTNFKVNDDVGTAEQWSPAISLNGSGNFVITWEDSRSGNYDIYAQRYDSSGSPLGSNFKVNDDTGTAWQWSPAIAMDGSGNFVITWYDSRAMATWISMHRGMTPQVVL